MYSGQVHPVGLNGQYHVHVKVDYATRFLMAEATKQPKLATTIDSWRRSTNIFGFPHEVYSDNASYFVGKDTAAFFRAAGTKILAAPVYSPSSAGLSETMVKLVRRGFKKWAYECHYLDLERWPEARSLPESIWVSSSHIMQIAISPLD